MQQDLFVKICGITNGEDAHHAVRCGADALGFVFFEESPRFISHRRAAAIVHSVPDHISKIGVFVNADLGFVREIVKRVNLSAVQLLGNEGPDDLVNFETSVIKVFRVKPDFDVEVMKNYIIDAFLLDAHTEGMLGGTGKTFDWNIAVKAKEYGRVILSGGLTPDNVEDAVRFVRPYGVDVSSGVEAQPGKKDPERIRDFIMRAKSIPVSYRDDEQL
ncbi:MAG: phosphoribosylanthranilate isomerase [Ignavibacteriales bacterium]|nr:phosphoribosylanthranilate isomerase [Ignavibacteriales bacterium]